MKSNFHKEGCPDCKRILSKAEEKGELCCPRCETYWALDGNGTARIMREINGPMEVVFSYPCPT